MEKMVTVEQAIINRRSTRNFDNNYIISKENQEKIISAGLKSPSPKNRQPWHYILIDNKETISAVNEVFRNTVFSIKNQRIIDGKSVHDLEMALQTSEIIENCSMLIFACYERNKENEHGDSIKWALNANPFEVADIQSIGASIQNMLLQACSLDIDSLWIADVLYAHDELCEFMDLKNPFIAAVAFGKAQKSSSVRKGLNEKMTRFQV